MTTQLAGLKTLSVAFYLGGFIAAPVAFFAWGACPALNALLLGQLIGSEIRAEVLAKKAQGRAA